jgi:hypothetical protein
MRPPPRPLCPPRCPSSRESVLVLPGRQPFRFDLPDCRCLSPLLLPCRFGAPHWRRGRKCIVLAAYPVPAGCKIGSDAIRYPRLFERGAIPYCPFRIMCSGRCSHSALKRGGSLNVGWSRHPLVPGSVVHTRTPALLRVSYPCHRCRSAHRASWPATQAFGLSKNNLQIIIIKNSTKPSLSCSPEGIHNQVTKQTISSAECPTGAAQRALTLR